MTLSSIRLLLGAEVRKFVAKLLDTTTKRIDTFLGARIKRMRLTGAFKLEQRQFATVFHLDGFAAGGARTRHKLETVGQVHKANFVVRGVNAFFHGSLCAGVMGSHAKKFGALSDERKTADYILELDTHGRSLRCELVPGHKMLLDGGLIP